MYSFYNILLSIWSVLLFLHMLGPLNSCFYFCTFLMHVCKLCNDLSSLFSLAPHHCIPMIIPNVEPQFAHILDISEYFIKLYQSWANLFYIFSFFRFALNILFMVERGVRGDKCILLSLWISVQFLGPAFGSQWSTNLTEGNHKALVSAGTHIHMQWPNVHII